MTLQFKALMACLALALPFAATHEPPVGFKSLRLRLPHISAAAVPAVRTDLLDPIQATLVSHLSLKYNQPTDLVTRIVSTAFREAPAVGFSPLLILAIIEKESSFNPAARSAYGAVGLMQVVPRMHLEKLADEEGKPDDVLKDPEANIRVGMAILAEYRDQQPSLEAALVKYSGNARSYRQLVNGFERDLKQVLVHHGTDA